MKRKKNTKKLQKTYDLLKNKGPTYIIGDINARVIYPQNAEEEEEAIGKHTMLEQKEDIKKLTDSMLENKELLIQFVNSNDLKIMNTRFKKHIGKLATCRIQKTRTYKKKQLIIKHMHK